MPTVNDVLIHSLSTGQAFINRGCEDLTPAEFLHRPCSGGNTTAWIIGHLVLTDRSTLGRLGVSDLPPLPEGFEKRFSREPEAPRANEFGDVSLLVPLFHQHRQRVIDAVRGLPAEALDRTLDKPHPLFTTLWQYLNFMGAHVTMHAGQITIIRRSLGRPPIV